MMARDSRDIRPLSFAISEIIALRGLARSKGKLQLEEIWRNVAGEQIGKQTKATGVKRGVLHIGVSNAPLLGELTSFHKQSLLSTLQEEHADQNFKDIKFRLRSDIV